ncbi:MAG: SEC-C metal-binding domain-containing protein [Christensenellales bacterium]|jgi:hypothetical protein
MGLYEDWNNLAQNNQGQQFWTQYFAMEKTNYEKILEHPDQTPQGLLKEVAEGYSMTPILFTGFLDGINSSLKQPLALDELEEDSEIALDIDLEKLYFNMLDAKADWLYGLPQWDAILSPEKRDEIVKEHRRTIIAVSNKVGRNEPCPCGSGKKYKKCCGNA